MLIKKIYILIQSYYYLMLLLTYYKKKPDTYTIYMRIKINNYYKSLLTRIVKYSLFDILL